MLQSHHAQACQQQAAAHMLMKKHTQCSEAVCDCPPELDVCVTVCVTGTSSQNFTAVLPMHLWHVCCYLLFTLLCIVNVHCDRDCAS